MTAALVPAMLFVALSRVTVTVNALPAGAALASSASSNHTDRSVPSTVAA